MFQDDDEEPKDWEVHEEDPPEQLKRKWIVEDMKPQAAIICPACKKPVPYDSLMCLFCGEQITSARSYLFLKFFSWVKKLFRGR
jgi:hypothetical protein